MEDGGWKQNRHKTRQISRNGIEQQTIRRNNNKQTEHSGVIGMGLIVRYGVMGLIVRYGVMGLIVRYGVMGLIVRYGVMGLIVRYGVMGLMIKCDESNDKV